VSNVGSHGFTRINAEKKMNPGMLGVIIGGVIATGSSLLTLFLNQKFQLTQRNQEWKKEAYVNFWKKFHKYFEIIRFFRENYG